MMGLHTSYRLLLKTVGGVVKVFFFAQAFKPGAVDLTVQDQDFTTELLVSTSNINRFREGKNYPAKDEKSLVPL